jgi:hypothetical protein
MANKPKFTRDQVLAALKASGGVYSKAAILITKATGKSCALNTIKNAIARDPSLQEALEEIEAGYLDLAESNVVEGLINGDRGYTMFYLKMKGRSRGYGLAPEPRRKDAEKFGRKNSVRFEDADELTAEEAAAIYDSAFRKTVEKG